jgi:hypothetical protein
MASGFIHVGVLHNQAHDLMLRRPLLEPRTTTLQPLAVAIIGGVHQIVPWGEPQTKVVSAQPLSKPTAFKRTPTLDADSFVQLVDSEEVFAAHSQESLMEAARLHAETHNISGNDLLVLNRGCFYLQWARLGVVVGLYDLPGVSPMGSGGLA